MRATKAEVAFALRTVKLDQHDDMVVLRVGDAHQGLTPAEAREVAEALTYFAGVQERADA